MDDSGGSNAGQTYLILGKSSGWAMDTDLSTADASFIGEDAEDYSGNAVSGAGDVNGDGYDDFIIGAYMDDSGGSNAGQTYLILSKNIPTTLDITFTVDARNGTDPASYTCADIDGVDDGCLCGDSEDESPLPSVSMISALISIGLIAILRRK